MNHGLLGFPLGRALSPGAFGFPLGEPMGDLYRPPPVGDYVAWFDAADASSLGIVSGAVAYWSDKGPSGYHLTQTTEANRPAYGSRKINGILVPYFDGVNDSMISSVLSDDITSTQFVVAVRDSNAAIRVMISGNGGTGGNQFDVLTNGRLRTAKEAIIALGDQSNAVVTAGSSYVACQKLTTTTLKLFLNGVSEEDAHAQVFDVGRTTRVGAVSSSANFWLGTIAEIIKYDRTLSDTEIAAVGAHLAEKWGTPADW